MATLAETQCLRMITDIWWPQIHREVLDQARLCEQGLQSGKNLKCMLKQGQIGKITEVIEQNQEVVLDFAGSFQKRKKEKLSNSVIRSFFGMA